MFQIKNFKLLVALLLISLFTIACGGMESGSMAPEPMAAMDMLTMEEAEMEYYEGEDAYDDMDMEASREIGADIQQSDPGSSTEIQERLIIRTAQLYVVVADTEESMAAVTGLANGRGGWVVTSSTQQYSDAVSGDMTIRVPAADFDNVMSQIKDGAVEVTSENVSGQDVTEEYVDAAARLENLEATAERVRGFLEDTETVEEALQVSNELSRLEGDIEALKGRLQYLSQSAAFSTISIHFTPDILSQPIEVAGWRPQGIARDAIEALIETLQGVASIAIWLIIYLLPLLLLVGLPLYFIVRWFIRRRRARRATPVASAE